MSILAHLTSRLSWRLCITTLAASFLLSGCSPEKPREDKKKDERTPQERVVVLKQRFDQLEASLHEMKQDVEIQKKRIESTQKIVDSIKHSLIKGGLKGYSIGNISTTDPLVLEALNKQQIKKQDKETREAEKKKAENTIWNALLIACFIVFIIAIFVVALKDKKSVEPVEPTVWEPTEPDSPTPYPAEADDEVNDTGSFEYGELRPPSNYHQGDKPESDENPEDRQQ